MRRTETENLRDNSVDLLGFSVTNNKLADKVADGATGAARGAGGGGGGGGQRPAAGRPVGDRT